MISRMRLPLVLLIALASVAAACGDDGPRQAIEPTSVPTAVPTISEPVDEPDVTPSPEPVEATPGRPTEQPATTPTALPTPTPAATSVPEPPATPGPVCAELSAGAQRVHPGEPATPAADLDGDGVDDEVWMTEPVDFGPAGIQVVRSSDGGITEPLLLDGSYHLFDAVLAASDIDADGIDEVFWSLSGNTLLAGVILDLVGCELRAIATEEIAFDYGDGVLTYPYFAGGNGCAPTGCHYSVTCVPTDGAAEIVFTSIYPRVSVLDPDFDEATLDAPLDDQEVMFSQVTVVVVDGVGLVVDATEEIPVRLGDIPEWTSRPEVDCA